MTPGVTEASNQGISPFYTQRIGKIEESGNDDYLNY